jgi:hypothetical protein
MRTWRGTFLRFSGPFCLLISVCACTKPVEIPELSGTGKPLPIETILLRDTVEAKDFKEIFRSLNRDGSLNSLSSWFEAPDAELQEFADVFTELLYEDAHSSKGLLALVSSRSKAKGFSDWKNAVLPWPQNPRFLTSRRALFSLFSQPEIPEIFRRDMGLLKLALRADLLELREKSQRLFTKHEGFAPLPPLSIDDGAKEIRDLLRNDSTYSAITITTKALQSVRLGEAVLNALPALREKHKGDKAFLGAGLSLRDLISQKKWQSFLKLAHLLNQPSGGIFQIAEEKLNASPDTLLIFSEKLKPSTLRGVTALVFQELESPEVLLNKDFFLKLPRQKPEDPPTPQFIALFGHIRKALNQTISPSGAQITEPLIYHTRLQLNSLVLTEWMEKIAALPKNKAAWEKLSAPVSRETLLKVALEIPPLELEIFSGAQLTERVKRNLLGVAGEQSESMQTLIGQMEAAFAIPGFGSTTYNFSPTENKPLSLKDALFSAIEQFDASRSFGDPTFLFASLGKLFVWPESKKAVHLGMLESGHMLVSLLRFIGGMDIETWRRFSHLLFVDLELGKIESDTRKIILELYPEGSSSQKLVSELLTNAQMLHEIDAEKEGLPSLLESLHAVLFHLPASEMAGVATLLGQVYEARIFEQAPAPRFPAILSFFQQGESFAEILNRFSLTNEDSRLQILRSLTPVSGWETRLRLLRSLAVSEPEGFAALAAILLEQGFDILPDEKSLTPAERKWIFHLVETDAWQKLWSFLAKHSSAKNIAAIATELKTLSEKGTLKDMLLLLGQMQSERMRLIAATLLEAERSGELRSFLETLIVLLRS